MPGRGRLSVDRTGLVLRTRSSSSGQPGYGIVTATSSTSASRRDLRKGTTLKPRIGNPRRA
jgi:hypothetical protein